MGIENFIFGSPDVAFQVAHQYCLELYIIIDHPAQLAPRTKGTLYVPVVMTGHPELAAVLECARDTEITVVGV